MESGQNMNNTPAVPAPAAPAATPVAPAAPAAPAAAPAQQQASLVPAGTPKATKGSVRIETYLEECIKKNASDLHIQVGLPPILRIDGALGPVHSAPI